MCYAGLKFAHLLPPGHILVKTAESLKQQQEFQAALAKVTPRQGKQLQRTGVPPLNLSYSEDGAGLVHLAGYSHTHPLEYFGTSGAGIYQQGAAGDVPSTAGECSNRSQYQQQASGPWRGSLLETLPGLGMQSPGAQQQQYPGAFFLSSYGGDAQGQLHNSLGQMRLQQQQLLAQQRQQFRAPPVSLEKLWKAGRAATTAAVLEAAHLPVKESPGDATSLLLTAGMVVQRQLLPSRGSLISTPDSAAVGATLGGTRSRLASRRASVAGRSSTANSRPNSARNRPSSATVPALQLQKLELTMTGGVEGCVHGMPGSSRPGSAAATSRLGPAHAAERVGPSDN